MRHEAKRYLETKIACDSLAAKNHHNLGALLDGDLKRLKFAALANPRDTDTRNDLALAIFKRGHWRRALEEFEALFAIDPNHSLAHLNVASVYASRGEYDVALRHAETAARLSPDNVMARRNLALLYDTIGDSRSAVRHNEVAIRNGPGRRRIADEADAEAYRRLAIQRVGRGETRAGYAHEHYDAYRALTYKHFSLPGSQQTIELLLKANQQDFPL
ncbi:hypothetical protein CTAYLR_009735 [Chrysophaeum taylorii]|uniref:Tetratricopeptide repeat protein n=1 Tax=Chrysophaeum taylorii TaxID=2483200 RepID=A0AAD7UIA1_9STRA|nr:hypothetical protein CTAYLR_009735 [Chrysophaeum taylorii]